MNTVKDEWGVCCPGCGSDEHLRVEVRSFADLTVDGTDVDDAHDWDSTSACRCTACDWAGDVGQAQHAAESASE